MKAGLQTREGEAKVTTQARFCCQEGEEGKGEAEGVGEE